MRGSPAPEVSAGRVKNNMQEPLARKLNLYFGNPQF